MTRFAFTIHATDGKARAGTIAMRRGEIRTPAFMPVGTAATVKAMKPGDVRAAGADIILGNTYHLMLRPTAERVARLAPTSSWAIPTTSCCVPAQSAWRGSAGCMASWAGTVRS